MPASGRSQGLLGQLGATYLVLFLAMLGIGILQNPMFGDGTPGGLARAFPDYGAGRIVIDGAFSGQLPRLGRARTRTGMARRSSGWPSRGSCGVGSKSTQHTPRGYW